MAYQDPQNSQAPSDAHQLMLDSRQIKFVKVGRQWFADLLRQGHEGKWIVCEGLPADAVVLDISPHMFFLEDCWAVKMWSSTFERVPDGSTIPELVVMCRYARKEVPMTEPRRGREFI